MDVGYEVLVAAAIGLFVQWLVIRAAIMSAGKRLLRDVSVMFGTPPPPQQTPVDMPPGLVAQPRRPDA